MKVTGFFLREKRKMLERRLAKAPQKFQKSTSKFPEETRVSPEEIMSAFVKDARAFAHVRHAQNVYNTHVSVLLDGEQFPLGIAVNFLGKLETMAGMWEQASSLATPGPTADRYGPGYIEINPEHVRVYPELQVDPAAAGIKAEETQERVQGLRAQIALANGKEVEIDFLNENLFLTDS